MDSRNRDIEIWTIRILACAALATSTLILGKELSVTEASGCGPGFDCDSVLSSRWSLWFGVPVVVPGAALLVAMLLATGPASRADDPPRELFGWRALVVLAATAAGAGVWFLALQVWTIGSLCLLCMAVHACSLVIAIVVTVTVCRAGVLRVFGGMGWPLLAGVPLLLLGALVLGQLLSHPVTLFELRNGQVDLSGTDLPVLGSTTAPRTLVVMSDYTCEHCRATHAVVERVLERYGAQLAVVELPVPLDPRCNPALRGAAPSSGLACDLARLALAVWRIRPEKFAQIDTWLFDAPFPRLYEETCVHASNLVGGTDALDKAERDPGISRTLHRTGEMYRQLGMGKLPKIVLPRSIHTGVVEDSQALFAAIEREFAIKPVVPDPK